MRVDSYVLLDKETGIEAKIGESFTTFRGDAVILKGGTPPDSILVESPAGGWSQDISPSYCNLEWYAENGHHLPEEPGKVWGASE